MSLSKPIPDYRPSEKFENGRPSGVQGMPIACRVCDRVFFDNVSLVLHFEVHVKDGVRIRGRGRGRDQSQRSSSSSSWSPCSYSSLAKVFKRMNDCLKSRQRDPNLLYISQPTITSSSNSQVDPALPLPLPLPLPQREKDGAHKNQEIIVISDDDADEDENKSSLDEIDLTLKL